MEVEQDLSTRSCQDQYLGLINMQHVICFDTKLSLEEVADHIYTKLGVKVMATSIDDTVNGALHSCYFPPEAKGTCWGGHNLDEINTDHMSVIVEVYEVEENANGKHKTKLKPKAVSINQLETELKDLANKKEIGVIPASSQEVVVEHVSEAELVFDPIPPPPLQDVVEVAEAEPIVNNEIENPL